MIFIPLLFSLISQLIYILIIRSDIFYGRGCGVRIIIHNGFRIISYNYFVFIYSDGLSIHGLSITLKSYNDIIFKIIIIYRPPNNDFTYFFNDFSITLKSSNDIIFKIIIIYRPPNNDFTYFFNDFSNLVINLNIYNTICMGDFNFHYGSLITPNLEFKSLIHYLSLKQHVICKTHYLGNTVDLVLTNSDIVYGIPIKSTLLTDHFTITFRLKLSNTKRKRALINYRNFKTLNINDFSNDIINSLSNCNINLDYFNSSILNVLYIYSHIRRFLVKYMIIVHGLIVNCIK